MKIKENFEKVKGFVKEHKAEIIFGTCCLASIAGVSYVVYDAIKTDKKARLEIAEFEKECADMMDEILKEWAESGRFTVCDDSLNNFTVGEAGKLGEKLMDLSDSVTKDTIIEAILDNEVTLKPNKVVVE